jgi:hypothetical protein
MNCKVCGRPLTSPESVALGVGPGCIKVAQIRMGKPLKVCNTCQERFKGEECPKCKPPGADPFAPSVTEEMPPAKEDSQ